MLSYLFQSFSRFLSFCSLVDWTFLFVEDKFIRIVTTVVTIILYSGSAIILVFCRRRRRPYQTSFTAPPIYFISWWSKNDPGKHPPLSENFKAKMLLCLHDNCVEYTELGLRYNGRCESGSFSRCSKTASPTRTASPTSIRQDVMWPSPGYEVSRLSDTEVIRLVESSEPSDTLITL